MDSNLGRGFYEVYCSSKEILKNKQRHLFCNMLDLLSNTSKSTPAAVVAKIMPADDLVRFWIEDVLPLAFDEDPSIQGCAVSALEQGLSTLDIGHIQGCSEWNSVKNIIVKEYASRLHRLRDDRSQYWHRVWCILIRLLDREILKSASTINLFLSIVELGFRSPDNNVRAEAFTCWHLLIQIFANHNQLSSSKRLKLVCIPLKSSQSKTPYVAAVKLRIWWYLITCLGPHIEDHFENVVEAFLIFCFGSESKSTPGVAQQYVSVREMALTCLASIVTTEQDEFLQRLLREYELETCQRSPIISFNIVEKHWKPILFSVLEATSSLVESEKQSDLEHRLLNVLIKSGTQLMIRSDVAPLYEYFCSGLTQIAIKSCRPLTIVPNVIATEGLRFSRSLIDLDNYAKVLQCLIKFLASGFEAVDLGIIERCITLIFNLDAFLDKGHCYRAVEVIADYLLSMPNDEGFVHFEVKFLIWRYISSEMVHHIRSNTFGRSAEEFAHILISWSLWPLRMIMEFTGRRNSSIFDEHFYSLWHNLLQLTDNTMHRSKHLTEVGEVLNAISKSGYEWGIFINLFNAYAEEVIKHDCSSFLKQYEQLFSILSEVIQKNVQQKEKEKLLTILRCVLHSLKSSERSSLMEIIKSTLKHAIRNSTKESMDPKFFGEWKNSILNIARASMDKNYISQVAELFKDDVYVIIPSVWSLKPEKLTDRQKERLAEKTNIPALYNDMSQSQDSLIKPWTPKKIVIAKEDQNEIVIEGSNMRQKETNTNKMEAFQSSTSFSIPKAKLDNSASQRNMEVSLLLSSTINKENVQDLPNGTTDKLKDIKIPEKNPSECSKQTNECDDELLKANITDPKSAQALSRELSPIAHEPAKCTLDDVTRGQSNDIRQDRHLDCIDGGGADLPSSYGPETSKEMSPKRTSTKNSLLLSPPDRKLTNNNSSPKLRPKPPAHLTGRGAQLINMIRNRKIDAQSPQTAIPRLSLARNDSMERIVSDADMAGIEHTSTPLHNKDILTFTKRLPSPSASPSTSILKRSLRRDSLEEIAMDSPACKKKRVSFHDPPVSVTKEYIKFNDENKSKPKRCLMMDKVQSSAEKISENKYALKRRSKLDSIIEIEKFGFHQSSKAQDQPTNSGVRSEVLEDDNVCCLDPLGEENRPSEKTAGEIAHNRYNQIAGENNIGLGNSNNLLEMAIQKYSLEELLEKYLDSGTDSKLKCYNTMSKMISKGMSGDSKIKGSVLEALSENHSKDFLDHAIRENLASVVCDRLNLPSVIEYVCEKSKINTTCRANVLLQVPDILKHCKQDAERLKFVQTILSSISLKDADILDVINTLLRMRSMDKTSSATVSEAAIDSSSNL
ncbi:telomere-associated protein RIF1 [Anastrepha obliqua]|uniref:telomere-associated protein RIF1 n=1 Tax=Anastrepha obliqua TaxID=95512 RepID=UPI002409B5A3|nr:telomere-associated protein RIF1 [Anastrepha obliqua]